MPCRNEQLYNELWQRRDYAGLQRLYNELQSLRLDAMVPSPHALPPGFHGGGTDAAIPDDTALSFEAWNTKVETLLAECGLEEDV